eukprot:10324526-Prorocentrum_lima.AAC.1
MRQAGRSAHFSVLPGPPRGPHASRPVVYPSPLAGDLITEGPFSRMDHGSAAAADRLSPPPGGG